MIRSAKHLILILVLSIPFIFWRIGSVDLLDPDEGLYGSIAKEMAESGNWVTPRFNGVRYLEKPPLYFWFTALTMQLFGPSEWAARLWSAIPGLGTAFLIWRLGNLLYGRYAGLLSALVFVTSVGVFRYTRVAATDFLLVFSVTLAIYGFVRTAGKLESLEARKLRLDSSGIETFGPSSLLAFEPGALLFWLGCAVGVLSKGLLGIIFPLLIVVLFALAMKLGGWEGRKVGSLQASSPPSFLALKLIYSPLGGLLFLGLVLPWHVLASWRNPGFFQFYILDNQFLRFFNSRGYIEDDIPIGTVSFLLLTLIWFFPWSLFLPAGIRWGFPRLNPVTSLEDRLKWVVGLWAIVVLGFFSLSGSKLEHYFLPAVPALSLMVGAAWAQVVHRRSSTVNGHSGLLAGKLGSLEASSLAAFKPPSLMGWCFGAGALGCAVVGVALVLFSDRLTSGAVFAGLGELNVYYRILKEQGAPFPFDSVAPFAGLLRGLGVGLLLALPLAFILFQLKKPHAAFASIVALSAGIGILVIELLYIIEPHHSTKAVAHAVVGRAAPTDQIIHEGSLEYSAALPFYAGRHVYVLNGRRGDLDFGFRYIETRNLYLDGMDFIHLWNERRQAFFISRYPLEKSLAGKLPVDRRFLVGRYGSRWLYTNQG